MEQAIRSLIDSVEGNSKKWYNTKEAAEITCLSPRSFRWLPNLKKKKDKKSRYIYIHKDSIVDIIRKNRSAILNWVRREDFCKEIGVNCRAVEHACVRYGIRQEPDISKKERIHPEDVDRLRSLIAQVPSQLADIIHRDGKTYYSLMKTVNDFVDKREFESEKERGSLFERKYKSFYRWIVQEDNNDFMYISVGTPTQIYVDRNTYNIISNSMSVKEAKDLLGISIKTVYNWIDRKYIRKYQVSKTSGTLNRDDVLACKHLPKLIETLRAKEIDFTWTVNPEIHMWDGKIQFSYNGGLMSDVDIFLNGKHILTMAPEDFRALFSERIRNNPYGIVDDGDVIMFPQLFFLALFKNGVEYKLAT